MKRKRIKYKKNIFIVGFIIFLLLIVAYGNERKSIITYNINSVKSIQAVHIVSKYESFTKTFSQPVLYEDFQDVIKNGSNNPVSFVGTLTGYGPDCPGCGGKTGCPPRQDVRNGNIYYSDATYGSVRIVATDNSIPCGSIIRIQNFGTEPIVAVALDRGGAIKGKKIDLLYESEKNAKVVGRQNNIQFDIIRWGW